MKNQNNSITNEIIHKELDMIQNCISRMSQNEFLIKGWYISVLAITIALKIQNIYIYGMLTIALSCCFYFFNMQFYIYENQYRELYTKIIKLRTLDKVLDELYLLKIPGFTLKEFLKYIKKGWPLLIFYFVIPVIFIIIVFFINNIPDEKIIIEIQGIKNFK